MEEFLLQQGNDVKNAEFSQVKAPLTEKTWGRACVIFGRQTSEMAASRFTSLSEENITQLLNDKDRIEYQKVDETPSLNF